MDKQITETKLEKYTRILESVNSEISELKELTNQYTAGELAKDLISANEEGETYDNLASEIEDDALFIVKFIESAKDYMDDITECDCCSEMLDKRENQDIHVEEHGIVLCSSCFDFMTEHRFIKR